MVLTCFLQTFAPEDCTSKSHIYTLSGSLSLASSSRHGFHSVPVGPALTKRPLLHEAPETVWNRVSTRVDLMCCSGVMYIEARLRKLVRLIEIKKCLPLLSLLAHPTASSRVVCQDFTATLVFMCVSTASKQKPVRCLTAFAAASRSARNIIL